MHGWHEYGHMGWMVFWWVLIIVALGALLWFVLSTTRRGQGAAESPEQALKRRYAKGEIDRETFAQMREDLRE